MSERKSVLPPVRNAWTGIAHGRAECRVCAFTTDARNAVGLANQHARRTGHEVVAEQLMTVTYNRVME